MPSSELSKTPATSPRLLLRFAPPCSRYVQIGQDDAAPSHGSRSDLENCALRAYAFEILGMLQVNEETRASTSSSRSPGPYSPLLSVEPGEIDERSPDVKHER